MKKSNCFALIGVVVLLFLGYSIPVAVMAVEDTSLLMESKSVEIDAIELNKQSMDMVEILDVFPEVLMNNIVVESDTMVVSVSSDETEETEQMSSAKEYEKIQSSIAAFWKNIGVDGEIEFVDFKAVHYVMMAASDDERVCTLWECFGLDEDKQEYVFWIEDTSGKIVAFEIPFYYVGTEDENFYKSMNALSNYYGFSVFGLNEYYTGVYKITHWENYITLLDKKGEAKVNIMLYKNGDKLFFNMYPKIYDFSEAESY